MKNKIKVTKINPPVLAGFARKVLYVKKPNSKYLTRQGLRYRYITTPLPAAVYSVYTRLKYAKQKNFLAKLRTSFDRFHRLLGIFPKDHPTFLSIPNPVISQTIPTIRQRR